MVKPWEVYGREPEEDSRTANEIMVVLEDDAPPLLRKYSGEATDLADVWGTTEPSRTNRWFGDGLRMRYLAIYLADNGRLRELDKVIIQIRAMYEKFSRDRKFMESVNQFVDKVLQKSRESVST